MRKSSIVSLSAIAIVTGWGSAQAVFLENFDGYADQAAFQAAWTQTTGTLLLDGDGTPVPQSAPNTVFQDTVSRANARNLGSDSVQLRDVDFSFDFYDGGAGLGRIYARLESRGTNATDPRTATLNQLIAIGKNNGTATTKYNARVALGSVNWVIMDAATSPNRTVDWHTFRVAGDGALAPTLTFYVDGLVGKTVSLTQAQGNVLMNWVVVGSDAGATSTTGNFDNIRVAAVPEPAAAILLIGGLPLVLRRKRR